MNKPLAATMTAAVLAATLTCARPAHADDASLYKVTVAAPICDPGRDFPATLADAPGAPVLNVTMVLKFPAERNKDLTIGLERRAGVWATKGTAGTIGLNPPLQVGSAPPAPPQKGETVVEILKLSPENTLEGKVTVKLAALGWGPKKDGKQKEVYAAAAYDVTFQLKGTGKAAAASDPDPATPGWRKNNARPTGWEFTGTFSATEQGKDETVKGEAVAGVAQIATANLPGTVGNAVLQPTKTGGVNVTLNLGDKRLTESVANGYVVQELEKTGRDLAKFDGLRVTVDSAKRRDDVPLTVAIQEARGAWYVYQGGALMLGKEGTFIVPFAEMKHAGGFDDDEWPELKAIKAVRVGAANGLGVGEVNFTLKKIEAVKCEKPEQPAQTAAATVEISVEPTTLVAHEGSAAVPKGLFGFHDVNTPGKADDAEKMLAYTKTLRPGFLRRIDHVGFGGPALTDAEIRTAQETRIAAAKARDRKSFEPSFAEQRFVAADATDAVMYTPTTNLWAAPPWMGAYAKGDLGGFFAGVESFYRAKGRDMWVQGDDFNPVRLTEVWNEPFMWSRHMNKRDPKFADPTQFSDQPGDLVTNVYSQTFKAAAKGFKSANKDSKIGGPCAASMVEDHYINITQFMGKFVDQCHDQIDFLTEHHYQGAPESYAAGYEIMTAYSDTRHGKRFPIYNTEANDLVDTPNKGDKAEDAPWDANIDQLNRAWYNAKDIVTMVRDIPDIAKGRAMHALWSGYCRNQGETDVYTLMGNLRGEMLKSASTSPDAIVLATSGDGEVVVLVMNDSPVARTFHLAQPAGMETEATLETLTYDAGTKLKSEKVKVQSKGTTAELPKRSMAKWTFSRVPVRPIKRDIEDQRRFYAKVVMGEVRPGKTVRAAYALAPETRMIFSRAYLRVVTDDVQRGEGVVKVGGNTYELPPSRSAGAVIQEIPIEVKDLGESGELEFSVGRPEVSNGYEVHSAAVVVVMKTGVEYK